MILCPMFARMLCEMSKDARGPPTRKESVPAAAPVTPRSRFMSDLSSVFEEELDAIYPPTLARPPSVPQCPLQQGLLRERL